MRELAVRPALAGSEVPLEVQKALVGHEHEDMTTGLYAQAPSRDQVRAAVQKLDWREPLAALFKEAARVRSDLARFSGSDPS